MIIDILTLFPEAFSYLDSSIIKRAKEQGLLEINIIDIRDFSKNKHKKCDDYPFGGGAGMLMSVEPVYYAVKSVQKDNSTILLPSPSGKVLNGEIVRNLAKEEHLIFICGHYEGFDERIRSLCDLEISIGDYILTGGELASMVLVDSIVRLLPGVITEESHINDSFNEGLLDYPTYTKPRVFRGMEVPEVLVSGNHKKIEEYRREESIKKTQERRPDLLEK